MLTALNDQLETGRRRKLLADKWKRHLEQSQSELEQMIQQREFWQQRLHEQQGNVDQLSEFSLTHLFVTFLGQKEDRLQEEKKALVEAKLKYDEASASVVEIEEEIRMMRTELMRLGNPDEEYRAVLAEKERVLRESASPIRKTLFEKSEQKAELRAHIKEIKEALTAGHSVLHSMERAEETLQSARHLGTWDMLGGGIISTSIKHSRINEAKNHVHEAQRKMRTFQKELRDIEQHVHVTFETGGMLQFADYFFDGLIVDWMVQGRINKSYEQVNKQLNKIRSIIQDLSDEERQNTEQLESLKRQYTNLIKSAV